MKNFCRFKPKDTSEVCERAPARWRKKDKLALLTIFLFAALFRFYGLNWDQNQHLHPDERMITMVTTGIHLPKTAQEWQTLFTPQSPLNPKFFAYGSLPIYLLKFSGWIFSFLNPEWAHYSQINLLGRAISGLADLGVISLIYLIGKKVWSEKVGLLAALFYALAVFPIQASHFYAVDTLLSFFVFLTLYQLICFYDKPNLKRAILIGGCFGLALATKVSATVLLAGIGTALSANLILLFLKKLRRRHLPFLQWHPFLILTILKFGFVIASVAAITFLLSEPYALIDFPTFWRQTQEQHQMTKSAFAFPYTLQYVGTTPYLYHLKNLVFWGMGIPLGILSLMGTSWLVIRLAIEVPRPGKENQEAKMLILVFFFLTYFLVVGQFAVKFMRYLLPLYPLLCLFAAWFWFQCTNLLKKRVSEKIVFMFSCFYVFMILIWPLSFISIYSKPNTRVSVSQWFNQNVSPRAKIAAEHWDDRVPMWGNYQFLEMPMYEPDASEQKWQQVNQNLQEADFLVLASNRLYTPLQKLADCQKYEKCYPKTAQYYQKLFSGKLGFKKVTEFTSYPNLEFGPPAGGWNLEFRDEGADESFTVYDHPKVMIFKKNDHKEK